MFHKKERKGKWEGWKEKGEEKKRGKKKIEEDQLEGETEQKGGDLCETVTVLISPCMLTKAVNTNIETKSHFVS